MIQPTWFPEPLTPAETAAAVVASDVAGTVEAAPWHSPHPPGSRLALIDYRKRAEECRAQAAAWPDSWLTEDDRRVWR